MSDLSNFPAFVQAIGVVAMYAVVKEFLPKLLGKNGKITQCPLGGEMMSIDQHDKECMMKLEPIRDKQAEMHDDLRALMRASGVKPKNGK